MAESPEKTRLRWKDNILTGFNKRGTASPNEFKMAQDRRLLQTA